MPFFSTLSSEQQNRLKIDKAVNIGVKGGAGLTGMLDIVIGVQWDKVVMWFSQDEANKHNREYPEEDPTAALDYFEESQNALIVVSILGSLVFFMIATVICSLIAQKYYTEYYNKNPDSVIPEAEVPAEEALVPQSSP